MIDYGRWTSISLGSASRNDDMPNPNSSRGQWPRRAAVVLLLLTIPSSNSVAVIFGDNQVYTDGVALSGEEVKTRITNNHLQGGFRARQLRMAFFSDGVVRGQLGLRGSDDGSWVIEGDLYCHHWVVYFNGEKRCYRWYENGDTYVLKNMDAFRTYDIMGKLKPGIPKGY